MFGDLRPFFPAVLETMFSRFFSAYIGELNKFKSQWRPIFTGLWLFFPLETWTTLFWLPFTTGITEKSSLTYLGINKNTSLGNSFEWCRPFIRDPKANKYLQSKCKTRYNSWELVIREPPIISHEHSGNDQIERNNNNKINNEIIK